MVLQLQGTTSCPPSTFCLRPITPITTDPNDRITSHSVKQTYFPPSNHELCLFRAASCANGSTALRYRCVVSTQPITDTHVSITINILNDCQGLQDVDVTVFLKIVGRRIDYYVINHDLRSIVWAAGQPHETFDGATRVDHEGELNVHMSNFPGLGGFLSSNVIEGTASNQVQPHPNPEYLISQGDSRQSYVVVRFRNSVLQSHIIAPRSFQIAQLFGIKGHGWLDATELNFGEVSALRDIPRNSTSGVRQQVVLHQTGPAQIDVSGVVQSSAMFRSRPSDVTRAHWEDTNKMITESLRSLHEHGCKVLTDTSNLRKHGPFHTAEGGCGYIFRGTFGGDEVAIKCPKIALDLSKDRKRELLERAAYESLVWWQCNHPNIQKLTAVAQFDNQFVMISPWMPLDLWEYITRYRPPLKDRAMLFAPICDAVAYLHKSNIVHGDIKASSEMLEEGAKPSPQSDVHSLGMTTLEVFTGSEPYSGIHQRAVMTHIVRGSLPRRPENHLPIGKEPYDPLWTLLAGCWALEPSARPTATGVYDQLKSIFAE
ncbi:unnamed protein product [Rhizoctonia solani]|uniref:Protein kinase domain-containing protein n=1 Tax=Rhizoctonia solani TaxID=456999 RepID=A0A8H3DRJ2_9AGAM|nr:unnamed protein product [Rhizoctonia solani]